MTRTGGPLCLILFLLLLHSCSRFERERKQEMVDKILATNDTLDYMTKQWHQLLGRAAWDNRFTTLMPYRLKIGQFLSRSRNTISNLEVSNDAIPIKDSELVFLLNRATIASDTYTEFESFNEWTPADVIKKQMKTVENDLQDEMKGNALIKKSLRAFVRRHELKVSK